MTWRVAAGLEGRGVLVTGAAGAIGRAVARAFAAAGATVVAVDLDEAPLAPLVASLDGPGRHTALAADLADLDGGDGLVEQVHAAAGRLDVLAHVAAVIRRRELTR